MAKYDYLVEEFESLETNKKGVGKPKKGLSRPKRRNKQSDYRRRANKKQPKKPVRKK